MATATLKNEGINSRLSRNEMQRANPENFAPIISGRKMRAPERMVYIYSTARRPFKLNHLLLKARLSGCENGERYVLCTSVPDPYLQVCPDETRGGNRIDEEDGMRVVIDALNTYNLSNDPWVGTNDSTFYEGTNMTNLIREGVFPSLNNPPTEEEIRKAEQCRDKRYRWMVNQATRLAASSTKELNDFLQQCPDVHVAMDALRMKAPWHTTPEVRATCPNCGDEVKSGIAFHQSSAGVLCVLDPERAMKAGAINRERYNELTGIAGDGKEPATSRAATRTATARA